jgi:hypothetical protein
VDSRPKIFDWRFLMACTGLIIVVYFVFVGIRATMQVDSLVHANENLSSVNDRQFIEARKERREAAKERAQILRYIEALTERQRKIYQFMLNEGIKLPEELLDPIPAPELNNTPDKPAGQNGGGSNNGGGKGPKNPPNNPGGGGNVNPPPTEPTEDNLLCLDLLNLEPLCMPPSAAA